MAELWDVLDEDGNNEYLIQKRSMKKALLPGVCDVTGGAVLSGEEGYEAAIREVYEELGITLRKESLSPILTLRRDHSFANVWYAIADFKLSDCILQEEEVDEVRFVSSHDMKKLLAEAVYREEDYRRLVIDAIDYIERRLL